jgi:hypothetical protein
MRIPDDFPASERAHFNSTAVRADFAASKGAVGAIVVSSTPRQFAQARSGSVNGIQGIVNKNGRVTVRSSINHPNMKFYAVTSDSTFKPIVEKLKIGDGAGKILVQSGSTYTEVESYNVIGVIPGSDSKLKNEYVVHTAHLDHVGIRAKVNGDSIYNGAHAECRSWAPRAAATHLPRPHRRASG